MLIFIATASMPAFAQSTEFAYQGSLQNSGVPANGNYDFEFWLFDALSGGSQLGPVVTRNAVAVSSGVFSVKLDFGELFPGANRFLEIHVRQSGGGAFTLLTPRQSISSSPYSIKSLSSAEATNAWQLGNVPAIQFVQTNDARLSDARPPTAGSGNYIQNTSTQQNANFNIAGTGTAIGLSANNISASQVDIQSQYGLRIGGITALSIGSNTLAGHHAGLLLGSGTGNSYFGQNAGRQSHGNDNAFFGGGAGYLNAAGSENSFVGVLAGNNSQGNNNSFFGMRAGLGNGAGSSNSLFGHSAATSGTISNATAIGAGATVSQSNSLVLGNSAINVGIGTTAPSAKLHVNGSIKVTSGAVYITNPNTIIITSPNGACWGITVNDAGGLATFPVNPCP
jgi:hypothetical protein